MIGWGIDEWGSGSWGGVVVDGDSAPTIPDVSDSEITGGVHETGVWPFMAGFDGRPWPDSSDPFELLLEFDVKAVLYVAVLMSLFSDARAPKDAALPTPDNDRRGWWASIYRLRSIFSADAYPAGSLLWLLSRCKNRSDNPARVEQYARAALKWMTEAGLASDVSVVAARSSSGAIACSITINNRGGRKTTIKFADFWEAYNAGKNP